MVKKVRAAPQKKRAAPEAEEEVAAPPAKQAKTKAGTSPKAKPAKKTMVKKQVPKKAAPKKAAPTKAASKKAAPKKVLEPVISDSDSESDYSDLDDEQKKELVGRDDDTPLTEQQLETLKPLAEKATSRIKKEKAVASSKGKGVVYLGHIPYGFFEDQMRAFFAQFGEVTRLRLSRNRKTGKSRHYAFIEFESPEVAKIVAETMNRYMMFGRTLVCEYIEEDKVHPNMFRDCDKPHRVIPWQKINREQHNKVRDAAQQKKRTRALLANDNKRRKKLEAMGIEYDYAGYTGGAAQKPKRKIFS